MLRKLINKFNRSLSERMVPPRKRFAVPIKVWFDPEVNSELGREKARAACILGETVDLSRSGIGFLVPSIRLKEKYLVGQERTLNIEVDLPSGKVSMKAVGRRYEREESPDGGDRFLIGVQITELEGEDKAAHDIFLKMRHRRTRKQQMVELKAD